MNKLPSRKHLPNKFTIGNTEANKKGLSRSYNKTRP